MTLNEPMPLLIQGDARRLPFADKSVDLIVTSPPYWSLRSYSDGGQHYDSQIGSEPTWQEYLDNLIQCTREMMRVLKPSGSIWLNLGDKYVADNRGSGIDTKRGRAKYAPAVPAGFVGRDLARQKSLMLLPHRYAIRCVDELGLIVRQDQVWAKINGLPESVMDRTRREHEYLFHMVKSPRYYSAVDEIRELHTDTSTHAANRRSRSDAQLDLVNGGQSSAANPLGKLPGSVWSIPSQPLNVPDHISHGRCCDGRKRDGCEDGLDHYAAFPFALARQVILGWSPREVCTGCGEGRRPVVATVALDLSRPQARRAQEIADLAGLTEVHFQALLSVGVSDTGRGKATQSGTGKNTPAVYALANEARAALGGYAREYLLRRPTGFRSKCACINTTAPTCRGVVLDPFGGTASAALVAAMNGRTGISIDASWDYSDIIARWRIHDPKERARAAGLDPDAVARIPVVAATQGSLWDDLNSSVS